MSSRARDWVLYVFRPAVTLVGRLRYAQKFVMVGLVLLVPLGFVAKAYVDLQQSQVKFSARERQGVEYMAPLIGLAADLVQARHLAVAGHDPGVAPEAVDLSADVTRVDAVDDALGGVLNVGRDWQATRGLVLSADRAGPSPRVSYDAYNAASDQLLALIVRVGDESNLTLDPNLDTYYLMDMLQFRLPVLLDVAGRSVDRVALAATEPAGVDTDVFIELGLDNGVLASTRKVITHAVDTFSARTATADIRWAVRGQFEGFDAAAAVLGDQLTTAVKTRQVSALPPDAAAGVRAAAGSFAASSVAALDYLLRARIVAFSARAHRVEIGTGLAALLAIYLFVGFYASVTSPIRRIVATLRAVAGGDLTQRVLVDTRDELGFVAKALNDTVAQTQIATDRLAIQATHDMLTSLPNRALVIDRLDQALARARRTGRLMVVIFVDLDRFKIINDSLGHEAGDEVLCAVADRLPRLVRAGDTVARLAGDEFVVIGEDLSSMNDAVLVAERVVAGLSEPMTVRSGAGGRQVSVGASVGIAFADGCKTLAPGDLLRDADVAMYRAKQRGRARVEIFDEALRAAIERQLEIQDDLRRGIETGQLRVHYQPIVDAALGAGRIRGFEALVRWQHPTRGLLGASDFIEVAEATGLVAPLGMAVLAEACQQTAGWRATRPGCEHLHIAVNVSSQQFSHPKFVDDLAGVLNRTGLDPDALWLEITETSIMAEAQTAVNTLEAIRALGVHLAIDDFGTGYSSLAYLRRFPVEVLKIDRSFVSGLGRDREDEAIIEMIVSLARTLDLRVIAEGVETSDQLALLRRMGCTLVQGFHFGGPAPPERALEAEEERRNRFALIAGS